MSSGYATFEHSPGRWMWNRIPIAIAVVVIAVIGWKLVKPLLRSEETKRLMKHHAQIRERLGDGLDPLFAEQVDAGDSRVQLRGKFQIGDDLVGYTGAGCAAGFDAAFKDVLGEGVVRVVGPSFDAQGIPKLELTAKLTAGESTFQKQSSQESFPSVALVGDIELGGVTAHVDVKPPDQLDIHYETYGTSILGHRSATLDEIRNGIVEGTCQEAGYALLEAVTTWRRPEPKPAKDPVDACKEGFHCREAADALLTKDPAKASDLYTRACISAGDDEACLLAASLVTPDGDYGEARAMLEVGCSGRRIAPCVAAATVALIPRHSGEPITDYERRNALRDFLRACDRGLAEACPLAGALLEGTPFAEAAKLPGTQKSVASKRFGTILALRWGQTTNLDRGQAIAWVTRRPRPMNAQTVIREFPVAELPAEIVAPPGLRTVYAVALERGFGDLCTACNPDQESRGYVMAPTQCICALTR